MSLDERYITTHDLGLATALVSCGYKVKAIEEFVSGRAEFVFTKTPEIERAIQAYWADTLQVRARKFFDNTKMLKSRIYGER